MASRPAPDFGRILGALTRALEARDLPFMVIGGQAVLVHGQPRLTLDIDITLGVEPDRLGAVLVVFSTTPYERQAIQRAVRIEINGAEVPFATAEDLILHKLFADRPRDREDALGVVRRQARNIDWTYLDRWAREFAAVSGREGIVAEVERLRAEA